jgi:transcriptional regulator with XRE-family HTH domain
MVIAILEEYFDRSAQKITWTEIAKETGVTTSALSHSRNDGTELSFIDYLNLAKIAAKLAGERNYINLFSDLCLKFKRPINIKRALEFLSVHRKLDHLERLIDIVKTEYNSKELRDWAEIYSIILLYQRDSRNFTYMNQLRGYSPKYLETKILSTMVEIYHFYRENEYKSMLALVKTIEGVLGNIKDKYIQTSISNRLFQILAFTHLYRYADIQKARYYAEKIISSKYSATLASESYYIMGMTFFFEDCDKCLAYLEKYLKSLEEQGRYELASLIRKNDIPFVQAHWGRKQSYEESVSPAEEAHFEAKWGDKEKALKLVEQAITTEGVSPFKLYYKALATGNASLFLESLVLFSKKGNKFFAKLPYEYLKDHPTLNNVAKLLIEN